MMIGEKAGGRTMSNDTHVTDVGGLVHKDPDLVLKISQRHFQVQVGFRTYCEVTASRL